ncbi:diguanylate cyclase domain-containing protein [Pseudoalteromonas denitrificans]|uniref:diguanylate cyclase n=1 Tax=Pseudoalteromonas denitrificans DSM 6059 TaxID=1123010 RepID=A0A1I1GVA3_9GAMM|nr:diguanylate cyclase [Pseudoalteromonas denitrificans]SFC13778.1 diguanylate cyclase (GGDEF) domain-containing protein [Pseudoalteromonas denitrificans DSM 6059]
MRPLKIKNQLNFAFSFSIFLTLLCIFIANNLVGIVSKSYEDVINKTLPIIRHASELSFLSKQIELRLREINNTILAGSIDANMNDIHLLWQQIDNLIQKLLVEKISKLSIDDLSKYNAYINTYLSYNQQFSRPLLLKNNADKLQKIHRQAIESAHDYSQNVLQKEMEQFARKIVSSALTKNEMKQLEQSYKFYKSSTDLLKFFKLAISTNDINELNTLKRMSVNLYQKMLISGDNAFAYKPVTTIWLKKIEHLYAGEYSLFKNRYDVLRLGSVVTTLINQQIDTASKIEHVADNLSLDMQSIMEQKKQTTINTVDKMNILFIIIIFGSVLLSFIFIWLFINKSLLIRITTIREKILQLANGDVDIEVEIHKNDELGDMEEALTKLKHYVQKSKDLSIRDSLTGLLNHAQFKENLKLEIKRNSRQNLPLSLAIIDIDFFKRYNDTYGHPKGDECLKIVSKLIYNVCERAGDSAYRIGGEEFAVLMPNTHAIEQEAKLSQLQSQLALKKVVHGQSQVSNFVTISIGIYSCQPTPNTSIDDFYNRADMALYAAKIQRNSIALG